MPNFAVIDASDTISAFGRDHQLLARSHGTYQRSQREALAFSEDGETLAVLLSVGFPSGVLAIASHILQNGLNIELQDEVDFESKWYQAAAQRGVVEATDWNVEGSRVGIDWNVEGVDGKGVLHTEKERPWSKPWDVFISHASEDKAQLVRPLADALKEYGVKVWYDSFSMQPGSNLGHSIDAGIAAAEFGIIVLSPRFIAKEWPRYEFDALFQRRTEQGGRLIILWHTLAQEDRPEWTKALDLEKCLDTATQPLTALTVRVLEWVRPDLAQFTQRRLAHAAMLEREAQGQAKKRRVDGSELHLPPRRYERLPATLVDRVQLLRAETPRGETLSAWIAPENGSDLMILRFGRRRISRRFPSATRTALPSGITLAIRFVASPSMALRRLRSLPE
jgi:hypothetical protein